jgi:hypothetical protein
MKKNNIIVDRKIWRTQRRMNNQHHPPLFGFLHIQKESHDKVSEKDLIDEEKVVTIAKNGLTKGKANLFKLFDNFPHGSVGDFVKDLSTKSDFAFF